MSDLQDEEELYESLRVKRGQYPRFDKYVESCKADIREYSIKTPLVLYVLDGIISDWDRLREQEIGNGSVAGECEFGEVQE